MFEVIADNFTSDSADLASMMPASVFDHIDRTSPTPAPGVAFTHAIVTEHPGHTFTAPAGTYFRH